MKIFRPLFFSLLILAPSSARCAEDGGEEFFFSLEKTSLEETLNIRTSVATRSVLPLRQAPGLVAVMTRDEIQASGARDLLDVLRMVPEFEFGVDVQGNLGLGVRGNWANEGKVLLIWDGQPYNELLYSTIQFDRFPVDQVEFLEIIKGPGSAVYGGFAELAVINVRTRTARSLGGSEVCAAAGFGGSAARYAGYSFGRVFEGGEFSAKVFRGQSRRSDGAYTDLSLPPYSFPMEDNSALRPGGINLQAAWKGASARLMLDDFSLEQRDGFTAAITTGPARIGFSALFAEVRREIGLPGRFSLEPRAAYSRAKPWRENDEHFPYDKTAARLTLSLTAFYRGADDGELLAGGEYASDSVEVGPRTGAASAYPGGKTGARYDNRAFFGQGALDLGPARFTGGARYDRHSSYGSSLVPRLALTRQEGNLHVKLIYSRAFRAPAIENIRLSTGIAPEKAASLEAEAGYKLSEAVFISANAFRTRIKDTIVFSGAGGERYYNGGRSGTKGGGASLKCRLGPARADLGYLYQEADGNRVGAYGIGGRGSYMPAFPRHKLTFAASAPLAGGLTLNPSAFFISRRYGWAGGGAPRTFGGKTVLNLNFRLEDRPLEGLSLNLGVRDLFGSAPPYIQPYDGLHAALPGPSREIFVKAAYEF